MIRFKDDTHKERYEELLTRYNAHQDHARAALAYLIALTDETYTHRKSLYNEQEQSIIPEGLNEAFQTGTTTRLTLLAFNLFTSSTAFCDDDTRNACTPDNIFCCELGHYFMEALKVRYGYWYAM